MNNFFATPEGAWGDGSVHLTITGIVIVVVIIALLLIVAAFVRQKNASRKAALTTKQLVYSAVAIALAVVCSMIKLFEMPMGGSVTLLSMLFIVLIAYWYGPYVGIMTAVAYGLVQFVTEPIFYTIPHGSPIGIDDITNSFHLQENPWQHSRHPSCRRHNQHAPFHSFLHGKLNGWRDSEVVVQQNCSVHIQRNQSDSHTLILLKDEVYKSKKASCSAYCGISVTAEIALQPFDFLPYPVGYEKSLFCRLYSFTYFSASLSSFAMEEA